MDKRYFCNSCLYKWESKKKFGEPSICPKCKKDNIVNYTSSKEYKDALKEELKEERRRKEGRQKKINSLLKENEKIKFNYFRRTNNEIKINRLKDGEVTGAGYLIFYWIIWIILIIPLTIYDIFERFLNFTN